MSTRQPPAALLRQAVAHLAPDLPVLTDLGQRFAAAGHDLALVGGPVRDALLGRTSTDLDFTTSARPDATEALLKGWGSATWDMGREFGTIGCRRGEWTVEVTTYRSEAYDPTSRKPVVAFGDNLEGDLGRRDFTVNAMAVRLPGRIVEDPYGGVVDLTQRLLRTPGTPQDSFSDDPLRMLRAARFAALMHDVGKPRTRRFADDGVVTFHHHDVVGAKLTRKRLHSLRFPGDTVDAVAKLVELHLRFHGYGDGDWTDSAVRRYVRDAGDQVERLHVLTRADCTTRNAKKADRLRRTYDDLESRIARLSEEEELASIRPDLDGSQIMEILGIPPGPDVGKAYRFLLDLRLDNGPMTEDAARAALLSWWSSQ